MPTLEEVKQQANKLERVSKFFARKEIKELPKILWENETIENMAQGNYEGSSGLLVVTNKRLVFVDKGFFKLKVEDFPYIKISSIQYNLGIFHGSIIVFCAGNRASISKIYPKQKARDVGDYIRARISKPMENAAISAVSNKSSIAERLKELAQLKETGILTEDEFTTQKQKILSE